MGMVDLETPTLQEEIDSHTQAFSDILANGHQLESLILSGTLECTPSSLFRQYRTALPFLRHFSLTITNIHRRIADRELVTFMSLSYHISFFIPLLLSRYLVSV
ncbi:hypothetical protein J3R83DRAFT_1432 [Lanmaoa asiatica]|nr:hypothetical protein J3R83DRAFT_1432 [Lanmaoa asiatica]